MHTISRNVTCSLEERRKGGAETVFEGIMTEIFPRDENSFQSDENYKAGDAKRLTNSSRKDKNNK